MTVRNRTHGNRVFRFFHGCNGLHEIPTGVPNEENQIELPNQAEQEQVHNNTGQILPAQSTSRPYTPQASPGDKNSIQLLQPNQNASSRKNASSDLAGNFENLNQTLQDQLLTIRNPGGGPIKILYMEKASRPTIHHIEEMDYLTFNTNLVSLLFPQKGFQINVPSNVKLLVISDPNRNKSLLDPVPMVEEPSGFQLSRLAQSTASVDSEPQDIIINVIESALQSTSQLQGLNDDSTHDSNSGDGCQQSEESTNPNHSTTRIETQSLTSLSNVTARDNLPEKSSSSEPFTRPE